MIEAMGREDITYKLTRLFVPLLLLSVGFTALYSLLDWLFVASSGLVSLDEDVIEFWLPMALAGIVVFIFIAPAVRPLKLSRKHNMPFLYLLIAWGAITGPAIIAQGYVKTATGTLTNVESAAAILSAPKTKFYAAKSVCLDRRDSAAEPEFEVSGNHNETLNFNLYFAVPVCDTQKALWIGLAYHGYVENSLPESQKEAEYQKFAQHSIDTLNALDMSAYPFLERAGINAEHRALDKALKKSKIDPASVTILIPHEEAFAKRTGDRLTYLAWCYILGPIVWFVMLLIPAVDREKLKTEKERKAPDFGMIHAFFIPTPSNYGAALLLDTNILVYLVMVFSGLGVISFQTDDLLAWGANYAPLIHGWGILRLFTSQFVHGGLMHLGNNMYGLLFAVIYLSPVAANARLIFFYLLCGLGGSIVSVTVNPHTPSIGASGAIFGLFGIVLMLLLMRDKRVSEVGKGILINVSIFVGLNLFLGSVTTGIDNAAHIGGLLTGAVIGLTLFLAEKRQTA